MKKKEKAAVMSLALELASLNLTGGTDPLITSADKPESPPTKQKMVNGDWVRCRRGPVRGAEGQVISMKKLSEMVTIVEVRQLNGNVIRLPRAYWEFTSFRDRDADLDACG